MLSVVVPSFQQAAFLEATLKSVCDQSGPTEAEVIVRDGGSSDGSVEILKAFGDRISWTSGPDGGQTAAINSGLQSAKGEIFCYLNSDDLLAEGAVRRVLEYFSNHPQAEMIYGKADLIDESGRKIGAYPVEPWDYERLEENCFISQPACFWRRDLHQTLGWFDEALVYSMDYDFWLRAGKKAEVNYLNEKLALARRHGSAKTVALRADSFEEAFQTMLRHVGKPVPRRWILALAQARAEKTLSARKGWPAFVREYWQQSNAIAGENGCREPLKLVSSIIPHCISAWKKSRLL